MSFHEFAELLAGLHELQRRDFAGGAALATLVQTRGPVFRRAGARMLVFGDGRVVRGLSAGCPEADIVERAREAIVDGHARLLRYDREHGYDTLLELGCGGEMEVLIEPLGDERQMRFAEVIAGALHSRRSAVVATVFARDQQCLSRPQRLIHGEQPLLDEIEDRHLATALLSSGVSTAGLATPGIRIDTIDTPGGRYRILLEPLLPALRLVLIGVNTTALALARLARGLGWEVDVLEHRESSEEPVLAAGARLLRSGPQDLDQRLALDARTGVVVMTHNLERDLAYLQALRTQPLAYLGALGSRSRALKMRAAIGHSVTTLHAPAGLDMGSETPEEIALAIAAEIQAALTGHGGGKLSASDGPIH